MILAAAALIHLASCVAAADLERDPFQGATEVRRFSFETDEDRDFDGQPDEWIRRKGPTFPKYVRAGIDRDEGCRGSSSLRIDVNGGRAILYSPPVRVDALHSYVFEGRIRTQRLEQDAAVISVSFLNHKRQRVQRFLSEPVSGTHADWATVRIGPVAPREDVRFVVVGCHLAPGRKSDIDGIVWFDELWLGMLPQLSLVSNFHAHFVQPSAGVRITSEVGGLDPGHEYKLQMRVTDSAGKTIGATTRPLEADKPVAKDARLSAGPARQRIDWDLPPQEYGVYHVEAGLERDGRPAIRKSTAFAVMDLVERRRSGEFGWTFAQPPLGIDPRELADVASQAGINWIKYPLWQMAAVDDPQRAAQAAEFFELLGHRQITPIGLLNAPPKEMREKFAKDWSGVSEIFTMPPAFWMPSLEPVLARYSSSVRHWQLGDDGDDSFAGMSSLPKAIEATKTEFDRIGRDTRIGVPWNWTAPLPSRDLAPHAFFSISGREPLVVDRLVSQLRESTGSRQPRWVVLQPLAKSKHTLEERSTDLVQRMAAAKIGGAEAIFVSDVFDPEHGLLNSSGSPTPLFLPWRSAALALQGAQHLGSFDLPSGAVNHVFAHDNEVVVVLWSAEPTTERLYLGENVTRTDVWGRRQTVPVDSASREQIVEIGPVPQILRGCSVAVARWRLAVRYEIGSARSTTEAHREAILGRNCFPQGVSGHVTLNVPHEWEAEPQRWPITLAADEPFRLPTFLKLPPNTTLGTEPLSIDFDVVADRAYRFRVHRPYQVGIGDVTIQVLDRRLDDGRLEIEQIIANHTSPVETLDLACSLFVPGHKRQKQLVTRLGHGTDRKLYYVPNADEMKGKPMWLRAEQVGGNRVLNYKWTIGERWDEQTTEGDAAATNGGKGAKSATEPSPRREPARLPATDGANALDR